MLQSRATIKKGPYVLIPTAWHVSNVIPGLEKCHVSILASPKLGAGFAAYQITAVSGGRTVVPFGKELDIELFLYVLKGSLHVNNGEKEGLIHVEMKYLLIYILRIVTGTLSYNEKENEA